MKQKTNGKRNKWKWLFLTLLALNVALVLVVFQRISSPREDLTSLVASNETEVKMGSFSTNREQLNETINQYLKDYQAKGLQYQLYLTQQEVVFEGEYDLLGFTIPLYIYFQPSKLEDGSILLTISEISAGRLSFPKAEVLAYLQKNYKLPDFVKVDAKEARVQIQLPNIAHSSGLYAKANTIDLSNDQFIIDLYRNQKK